MQHVEFRVTHRLQSSNEAVWNVLGDFGTEHRWTKSLTHCERDTIAVSVGTIRTCTLPRALMGRTKVSEQLTEYTPMAALAYELDGAAGPFASAKSRWSTNVREDGTTELCVEGHFVPRGHFSRWIVWPLAKTMIQRLTKQVMRELESYVTAQSSSASLG
jgi:hypothetical protein